jgi:hypothetical protein
MNKFSVRRFRKASLKNKGVSIVEAIVVITLVSVVSVVIMDLFITHGRIFNLNSAGSDFQLQGAEVVEAVGRVVRVADKTVSSRTINSVNYTASAGTLVLEIPSIDSAGQVIAGKYDYAAVYLSNNKIFVSQQADPASSRVSLARALSDSVSRLQFIYDNGSYDSVSSVLVQLAMSKNISGKTRTLAIDKKFNLGNK